MKKKAKFSPLPEAKQKKLRATVAKAMKAVSEIATEFGVSRNTVMYYATKLGVKLPKLAGPRKKKAKAKKKK